MGAETTIYVKVLKHYEEWIQVSAVTRLEAEHEALRTPDVITVLEVSYDPPNDIEERK
jgi:hypothetical protein